MWFLESLVTLIRIPAFLNSSTILNCHLLILFHYFTNKKNSWNSFPNWDFNPYILNPSYLWSLVQALHSPISLSRQQYKNTIIPIKTLLPNLEKKSFIHINSQHHYSVINIFFSGFLWLTFQLKSVFNHNRTSLVFSQQTGFWLSHKKLQEIFYLPFVSEVKNSIYLRTINRQLR